MIVVWHMFILYDLSRPKYFIQDPKPNSIFFQVLEVLIFQNFSVTGRPAVDRHSTDMHKFCACEYQSTGTRPILDRPQPVALWKCPVDWPSRPTVQIQASGRLAVDRSREFCSLEVIGRPSRSTGGCNGQKNDRWPVDRRSTASSDRTPTALFLGSLYKGILSSVLRLTFWRLLEQFFRYF